MSNDSNEKPCPGCGRVHEIFTPAMKEALAAFEAATDPNEKEEHLIELANLFIDHTDSTNLDVQDDVHALIQAAVEDQLVYHNSVLKVGRLVARSLSYQIARDRLMDKILGQDPPSAPSKPPSNCN